ncbi:MAG: hypothetical protein WD717_07055 [Nitrosarchaeum sp.]
MVEKIERVTTSIKVRPDVWKKAKIEAIKEDLDLSELVEKAIEAWVRGH